MAEVFITINSSRVKERLSQAIDNSEVYEVTGMFSSPKKCKIGLAHTIPHILLLGHTFAHDSAAEFCTEIREQYPNIKILMLAKDSDYSIIKFALDHGTSGYIRKDALPSELITALNALMNGKEYWGGRSRMDTWGNDPGASPEWFIPLEKGIDEIMKKTYSYEDAIEKMSFIARYVNKGRPLYAAGVFEDRPQELNDKTAEKYLKILIEYLLLEGYSNWEIAGRLNINIDTARIYRLDFIQKLARGNSMLFAKRNGNSPVKFSDRDIQLLRLIAAGLTTEKIANELILTSDAIHSRRQLLTSKAGASNMMELITDALSQGLIKMEDIVTLLNEIKNNNV
jgi:DNA-binding NarL/FixJ family response regulator